MILIRGDMGCCTLWVCQQNVSDSTRSWKTSTKSAVWMRNRIFGQQLRKSPSRSFRRRFPVLIQMTLGGLP